MVWRRSWRQSIVTGGRPSAWPRTRSAADFRLGVVARRHHFLFLLLLRPTAAVPASPQIAELAALSGGFGDDAGLRAPRLI